jgi:hypothetical protein
MARARTDTKTSQTSRQHSTLMALAESSLSRRNLAVVVVLWIACGYCAWGLTLGYFTYHYPADSNSGIAGSMAIFGPVGLLAAGLVYQPHHWRVVPMTTEERWEAFHKSEPTASREYFEQRYN